MTRFLDRHGAGSRRIARDKLLERIHNNPRHYIMLVRRQQVVPLSHCEYALCLGVALQRLGVINALNSLAPERT